MHLADPALTRQDLLPGLERLAGHRPSHLEHLHALAPTSATARRVNPAVDAVVVPTNRSFSDTRDGIGLALRLAAHFGSRLLLLCSGGADVRQFPTEFLSDGAPPVAVVNISRSSAPAIMSSFETSDHRFSAGPWNSPRDVAEKRNLALLVAAAHRWRSVVFLDDDLRPLGDGRRSPREGSPFGLTDIDLAVREINADSLDVVGWVVTDFPDNSVVCHARSLVGDAQRQFVGGGSLAVRVSRSIPFFPRIYNEDWLFLYPLMHGQPARPWRVANGGDVGQAPYDPFEPARAAREEMGDLMAEGLFGVLGSGDLEGVIWYQEYWEQVILGRRRMIADLLARLRSRIDRPARSNAERETVIAAKRSLEAALDVHRLGAHQGHNVALGRLAGEFVDFLHRWERDLARWHRALAAFTSRQATSVLQGSDVWVYGCSGIEDFLSPNAVWSRTSRFGASG
jgi:hypothetical protein